MQDFRKLKVWHRAHAFAVEVRARARAIPPRGNTEFKAQLTSAADSIANNIVEGCGSATRKEFARFLDISIKSTSEVEYQLQSARDNNLLGPRAWRRLTIEVREIRMMLFGLRRAVLDADAKDQSRKRRAKKPGAPGVRRTKPATTKEPKPRRNTNEEGPTDN